jgi:hypothetical protein
MPEGNGFLGLPMWVWIVGLIIVGLIAWFFLRGSGSSVPPTTGGGGGAANQNVRLNKGAVVVNINAADEDTDQPKPPEHRRRKEEHKHVPIQGRQHRKTFGPPTNQPPHKRLPPKRKRSSK